MYVSNSWTLLTIHILDMRHSIQSSPITGRWWGPGPGGMPGAAPSLKTAATEVVRSQQAGPPAQQSKARSQVTSWNGEVQGWKANPVTWWASPKTPTLLPPHTSPQLVPYGWGFLGHRIPSYSSLWRRQNHCPHNRHVETEALERMRQLTT